MSTSSKYVWALPSQICHKIEISKFSRGIVTQDFYLTSLLCLTLQPSMNWKNIIFCKADIYRSSFLMNTFDMIRTHFIF